MQDDEDLELDRLAGFAPMPPSDLDPPQTIKPRGSEQDEIIRKDADDAYEECYPGYEGFNGAIVDSDDEDLTHMDNNQGKSRYDFGTEQEWEVNLSLHHASKHQEILGILFIKCMTCWSWSYKQRKS